MPRLMTQVLLIEVLYDADEEATPSEWLEDLDGVTILEAHTPRPDDEEPLPNNVYTLHMNREG